MQTNGMLHPKNARDGWIMMSTGLCPLLRNKVIPEQMLHGGHHFDKIYTAGCCTRQQQYERSTNGAPLPWAALHFHILLLVSHGRQQ
jgi:hypothetical protein